MSTANTHKSTQPESDEFNTLNALAKEYEEEAFKTVGKYIATEALAKEASFMDFLAKKIPVKSHVIKIIKWEETRDFLVSSFLSQYKKSETPKEPETVFTPEKLLEKIGYSLSNPTDLDGILSFTHFYKKGEYSNTMYYAERNLKDNHIFFLTHKNAANIPHANDLNKNNLTPEWKHYLKRNGITDINGITPRREDPYGTSVLCVQINRSTGTALKIINRYNHSVTEPDFTFGGNLDKLIPGLEQAIYSKTDFKNPHERIQKEPAPNLLALNRKFYFYTQKRAGVYWGDGFVYANGKVTVVDSSSERIVDGYILSLKERKPDPFPKGFDEPYLEGIQKVEFPSKDTIDVWDKQGKKATLKTKDGCLISFHSDELTEMEDNFLYFNHALTSLSMPKLKTAGNNCFRYNRSLTFLSCDNLEEVKDNFFYSNNSLTSLSLNNLKKAGPNFFFSNNSITFLSCDNLKEVESNFFFHNNSLTFPSLNNLKKAGPNFFFSNNSLTFLSCDNLKEVGAGFFHSNNSLTFLSLDNLEKADRNFFFSNNSITFLSLINLKEAESGFFYSHKFLKCLFPKDFSNGICVSLENKEDLKNIHKQEIQETAPSIAPPNGTFLPNGTGTVICGEKDGKNASEK